MRVSTTSTLPTKLRSGKAALVASTRWPGLIWPNTVSGRRNSISISDRSSSVVRMVEVSTRAPTSTERIPRTPAKGARTVRSSSCCVARWTAASATACSARTLSSVAWLTVVELALRRVCERSSAAFFSARFASASFSVARWIAVSSWAMTSPAATSRPGWMLSSVRRPSSCGTTSIDCSARVVPTASTRSCRLRVSAFDTSTEVARWSRRGPPFAGAAASAAA